MMKNFKQGMVVVLSLFVLVSATSGCALLVGAAAGAGGYAWSKGDLERNFDYSVAKIHKASLKALKSLGIFVREDELKKHSAKIKFEYENGKKGEIKFEALTERATKIKIRIGIMGNKEKSQIILNSIQKRL